MNIIGLPKAVVALTKGVPVPAGYTRTTFNAVPVTFNTRPVYDNGASLIYVGT